MSNHDHAVIRAAAYQQERARLDRKTRTKAVQCVAPNRKCGSRCIPPEWDCRLKGEGQDPHLRALGKGADPVSGLANIERGLGRVGKGVTKLSFSEIEGGRKAIARGTAKLLPGDLKRKEAIKKQADVFLGRVLFPVSAVIGATLLHRGLNNFRIYRQGVGQQIDESARSAFNMVRVNVPIYGERIRQRQAAGEEAVNAGVRSYNNITTSGAESLFTGAGERRTLTEMVRNQPTLNSQGLSAETTRLLDGSLIKVDGAINNRKRPSGLSMAEWHGRSLEAFWTTQRSVGVTPNGIKTDGPLFSLQATNDLLAKSFGIDPPKGSDLKLEGEQVISRIREVFQNTGESIRTAMEEDGLDTKNVDQVRSYIGRTARSGPIDEACTDMLVGTVIRSDYERQAQNLYRNTLSSYDRLFGKVADDVRQAPSIDLMNNRGNERERKQYLAQTRQNSYFNDAVEAHSHYLNTRLNLPAPVYGSYTGVIARRAYHTRYVAGPRRLLGNNDIAISLTRTEAFNAGIEIAKATGIAEPKTVEDALHLVVRTYGNPPERYSSGNAIGQIGLVTSAPPRRKAAPVTTTSETSNESKPAAKPKRKRTRSKQQIVQDLLKQKNRDGTPSYTRTAAEAEADRIISLRKRADARADAYLLYASQLRLDTSTVKTGKPCGKSHIAKGQKCHKGEAATQTTANKRTKAAAAVTGAALLAAAGVSTVRNREQIVRRALETQYKVTIAAINKLSSEQVKAALNKVPDQFQDNARNLVGKTKVGLAAMLTVTKDGKLIEVDKESNSFTFEHKQGGHTSISSVGDALVIFRTHPERSISFGGGEEVKRNVMDFTVDGQFGKTSNMSRKQSMAVIGNVKTLFNKQLQYVPDESYVTVEPYGKDELGNKRKSIYEKWGFTAIGGDDSVHLWALKSGDNLKRMNKREVFAIKNALRSNATKRDALDK